MSTQSPNIIRMRDGKIFDHRILRFRYEVLREDVHSLAESVNVPVELIDSLARAEAWQRLEIDEQQEDRIRQVQQAAKLRIQCLNSLRQLERFYTLSNLEEQALQAIGEKLKDTSIKVHELAKLVKCIKLIQEQPEDMLLPNTPEPVKAYIDIRQRQENLVHEQRA